MASIKDYAAGTVLTAPSPATSGTSITLQSGEGAFMPPVPFYATVVPVGYLTNPASAEKVYVTARPGNADTFTIVRAQTPTTAKTIATGWIFANSIFADDVFGSTQVMNEIPAGTVNGTNAVFTTAAAFTSIAVHKNGLRLLPGAGNDYTVTANNQITFASAPATGSNLTVDYITGSQVMINGSNSQIEETPAGTVNGLNPTFTASRTYVSNTLEVYINGIKQKRGIHFTEGSSGAFTMSDAPSIGDDILIQYQYSTGVYGNASSVNGFGASQTPAANVIPVLDGNGLLPFAAINANWVAWSPTVTPSTGAFSNMNRSGWWTRIGNVVFYRLTVNVVAVGTAAGPVIFTLPVTAHANNVGQIPVGFGREGAVNGSMLEVYLSSNTAGAIAYYNNNTPSANGAALHISGFYEAA